MTLSVCVCVCVCVWSLLRACAVPEMTHGFVVRGDLTKPEVLRDVEASLNLATEYFKANL